MSRADHIKINDKIIPLRQGVTGTINLDVLFHAILSNRRGAIDTDVEGLRNIVQLQDDLALWAFESVGCVGELLTAVDHTELSEGCLKNLGWLLKGISELQNALSDAEQTLIETREALIKTPEVKKTA